MTNLNPLDALIPKIPFSFFSDFWVWVRGPGVSLGRILGVLSIEPFLEGGPPEGSIDPPPPRKRKPGLPSEQATPAHLGLRQQRNSIMVLVAMGSRPPHPLPCAFTAVEAR